ncbi:MAG: LPS assembly lipoprotein LptE [Alphaproteobacteria bacterium]|nr:LPS assembly lipoprotein LptE [Alphaproteobacteria bacterium]
MQVAGVGMGVKAVAVGLGLALILAACSFRPLYGTSNEGNAARIGSETIAIGPIGDDRVGQQLRNGLINRLTPRGQPAFPAYQLDVTITDSLGDLLVQEDSTVLRRNYKLTASYRLVELATGDPLHSSTVSRTASLNRSDSEYANVIAQRDAEERAAEAVADVLAQRLGIELARLASPKERRRAAIAEAAKIAAAKVDRTYPPEPLDSPLSPPPADDDEDEADARFPAPVAVQPGE